MALGRIAVAASGQILHSPFRQKISTNLVNGVVPMIVTSFARHLSTIKLTNNLSLITGDKRSVKIENLKLKELQNRPLVVLLTWLMAKPKHVHKFADYYIDKGFDVLNVNTSPWQLLWPVKGAQIIADEMLNFFDINEGYKPIVLHGFSVGAYQWGEALVKLEKNQEFYKNVLARINGHIWDSAVDYEALDKISLVMFPNSILLQKAFTQYMIFHVKAFDKAATRHYIKSSQLFHSDLIKAPALFLLSKSDPLGLINSNLLVKQKWENAGVEVQWKCWDNSPHVGHYYFHRKEYIEQLDIFLKQLGIPAEGRQ